MRFLCPIQFEILPLTGSWHINNTIVLKNSEKFGPILKTRVKTLNTDITELQFDSEREQKCFCPPHPGGQTQTSWWRHRGGQTHTDGQTHTGGQTHTAEWT